MLGRDCSLPFPPFSAAHDLGSCNEHPDALKFSANLSPWSPCISNELDNTVIEVTSSASVTQMVFDFEIVPAFQAFESVLKLHYYLVGAHFVIETGHT